MKKYVIGTIATMALLTVGCSDDQTSEQLMDVTSRTPMTFVVSHESLTRLDYIENVGDFRAFTVVAQLDGAVYLQGQFTFNPTSGNFEPANPALWKWPGNETQELEFYATNTSSWMERGGIETGSPITNYSMSFENRLDVKDDISAYVKTSCADCKGVVHLKFVHMLSEVGILVRGEFPAGVAIPGYHIKSIDIDGQSKNDYHFDSNEWTVATEPTPESFNYYTTSTDHYLIEDHGDAYTELLEPGQAAGDTFRFIQPGTYDITINYLLEGNTKSKTAKAVTLKQGEKNRINLTLPYEPS